ncbi:MAG: Uma2 family endonuclease [Geitlerinemataceae cyanobacterium]
MVLIPQKSIVQEDPPKPAKETLPTMYDLPSEDSEEPGLPDEFHDLQPQLLSRTLRLTDYPGEHCFTASDLNLYYDVKHPLWHKRPDWFLVVDVPRLYEGTDLRRSYVIWQEGKSPDVVIEFLSPGTESEDLGRFGDETKNDTSDVSEAVNGGNGDKSIVPVSGRLTRPKPPGKVEVYEQYLRVPHYIVYSRYTQQLRYFKLDGGQYREQPLAAENPRLWLADLGMGLGIWEGVFEGISSPWLRWCDRDGNWQLTDTEQAQLEKEQAQLEKEQAQTQLRQAAQNLLATGMEASQVAQILGLSAAQVQAFLPNDE